MINHRKVTYKYDFHRINPIRISDKTEIYLPIRNYKCLQRLYLEQENSQGAQRLSIERKDFNHDK